ncbi:MAG: xanthan lyase [Muribaculaceae bacterium]|nr:xanthan lyase [Muribaculaceae bacterium]
MNSKRYLTLLAAGAISLGVCDWIGLPNILNTEIFETSQASAAKKKSKKKSTKKRSTTTTKKTTAKASTKRSGSKKKSTRTRKKKTSVATPRATATLPPVESPSNDSLTLTINERLIKLIPSSHNPGGLRVNKVKADTLNKKITFNLNENFTYLPINKEYIEQLQGQAKEALPDSMMDFSIDLTVSGKPLSYFINTIDKLPKEFRTNIPFVRTAEPLSPITKGMQGDNIAMWHSHGRYYKPGSDNWYWQRPFLFQAVEDTYTLGYILPYAVPMLENAGAYVFLPRERDINPIEVIVDNDQPEDGSVLYSQNTYFETNGHQKWENGQGEGFIYDLPDFRDTENPFENGTYRQVKTTKNGSPSTASWIAEFPESREYAVYVSYKSLPNSSEDARYTINYDGGSEDILVNQKLGGGTWIYLGTYPFAEGYDEENPTVVLTSRSEKGGDTVVTADAVKIGGGMGNIARSPKRSDVLWNNVIQSYDTDSITADDIVADIVANSDKPIAADNPFRKEEIQKAMTSEPVFKTSGLPRWLEGARYWLQWAGMPDSIYAPYAGTDDYKDDYTSRGLWVNYLAGGSRVLPKEKGLGIPIDATMALHSDAGKRSDDTFIGTLGIYFTNGNINYADGTPRKNSRTMTDMIMRQITGDIRAKYEPEWTRRPMWDKSYVEARVPEVPTTLIELLSHQNFADMQYGNDPRFRFTVGRAIYKALARFIGERKDRKVVIQPLPVRNFAIQKTGKSTYRLSWQPTPDELEPTAMPTGYIVMERSGEDMSFHKIGETTKPHFEVQADDDEIHSFKIIAFNEGGRSFPSEVLAFRHDSNDAHPILIINGFTRISAPSIVADGDYAGFDTSNDFGVPYIKDVSFTGYQTEFHRSAGDGFGKSSDNYVASVIAGNTFDYPSVHGCAIAEAGRGFVSTSVGAVEQGSVNLSDYKTVDLILGKQKATTMGRGNNGAEFFTFPKKLRNALTHFLNKGGDLIVSGQYVASDLRDTRNDNEAARWGEDVLLITVPDSIPPTLGGKIDGMANPLKSTLGSRRYSYSNTLNEDCYIVEHPDAIIATPKADESATFLRFSDTDAAAGLLIRDGKSRRAVMSVPFESITDPAQRNSLMKELLDWIEK